MKSWARRGLRRLRVKPRDVANAGQHRRHFVPVFVYWTPDARKPRHP